MFRFLFRILLITCLVGPFVALWAAFEAEPDLPAAATLKPGMVVQARALASRTMAALDGPRDADGNVRITATQPELDSVLATAARVLRPLRGVSEIGTDALRVALSAQVPGLTGLGWVNVSAQVAASDGGFDLRELTVGRLSLPPALTLSMVGGVIDLVLGDDLGTRMLRTPQSLRMEPGKAELVLAGGGAGGLSLFEQLKTGLWGLVGLGDGDSIERHHAAMARAARDGILPTTGSTLPWIRFAVAQVAATDHPDPKASRADMRAALLALAAHCGDRRAVQTLSGTVLDGSGTPCSGTTLKGRSDLRQHFTLSAALVGAGGATFSIGMGEVKELVDAGKATGSGFSFDDMAMNRAGIRFAERVLVDAGDLGPVLQIIQREADIVPVTDDLPSLMSEAEFLSRFGSVDSAAYLGQVDMIERRVAALPLHTR